MSKCQTTSEKCPICLELGDVRIEQSPSIFPDVLVYRVHCHMCGYALVGMCRKVESVLKEWRKLGPVAPSISHHARHYIATHLN